MKTATAILDDAAQWGEARLLANGYPGARCAGCGHGVPTGDPIAYYGLAPRGCRTWHPACVAADSKALAATRAIAEAQRAMQRGVFKGNEFDRKAAVKAAYCAVLDWIGQPGMQRLGELLATDITRHLGAVGPADAAPLQGKPILRLIVGGGCR